MTTARPAASTTPPPGAESLSRSTESPYRPRFPVRLVTAASLFDGHDASINIMRRILQASGAEVIHLGHNRSVAEIVDCALQEDVQGIALTSYQGGHIEYLRYMRQLLDERGAEKVRIYGGGGGTILPDEIAELHAAGITRIFSPDDGLRMGLQGMIDEVLRGCDYDPSGPELLDELSGLEQRDPRTLGRLITLAENHPDCEPRLFEALEKVARPPRAPVLGITGTGGSGKSSLVDELVRRFLQDFPDKNLAIVSVDPSKRRSGGALLGDRIRMNAIHDPRVFMRSLATRQQNLALSRGVHRSLRILAAAGFDLIILETSGIGQSDTEIVEHSDTCLYVMTAEYGAATQLEKIDMLDFADLVAINKFEKAGSRDALRDVRKQVQRNRGLFDQSLEQMPVMGTIASQFADPGVDKLYTALIEKIVQKTGASLRLDGAEPHLTRERDAIIPADRARYLAEIVESSEQYDRFVDEQVALARRIGQLEGTLAQVEEDVGRRKVVVDHDDVGEVVRAEETTTERPAWYPELEARLERLRQELDPRCRKLLESWPDTARRYRAAKYQFKVRDRVIEQDLSTESLSGTKVPKVCLPRYEDPAETLRWLLTENVPGVFPYTAGVFPLKRQGEDPARMFAGEGGPERTNRRFHYVSRGMPAKRLSTAFDSVTLYGEDPDSRPDIYGKIGNSGVSIANLDDAKRLYSGFDLCDPRTSVSMTINGPAPMLLSFFLNTAIDQQCEKWIRSQGRQDEIRERIEALHREQGSSPPCYRGTVPEGHDGLGLLLLGATGDQVLPPETYAAIRADALRSVRGTVQADILKEDQAQNTCIFSTEFALRMMGDIQQSFIDHEVQNFYSVSISGYHMAEAGANPITQLALTLANGFTYVEYYLSRGMDIDDFAPNLSFFFSNGLDPEYAVIGRVARRIWAKAMRLRYGANARSQRLKYHIQTSGRSLHAQEISFNDIRTTLQALYALYDNCNSLHTNAYDEAITTPTEESVRRALAIQLIINKELGLARNENPMQGSFVVQELTELVEQAVLEEFRRLSERGGVLGAMERMYQRSKIQEESLLYESRKHSGELPIVGVNTFLSDDARGTEIPVEVIRSTEEEKQAAIANRDAFQSHHAEEAERALAELQKVALEHGNTFEALMQASKVCTLGQITHALYEVGGQYRRNM